MTLLSIIVPVYNERRTIQEVVRRVEAAPVSLMRKELIIVDDDSTDGTRQLLGQYEGRHTVVYHERNLGKGGAVRTGLRLAKGDYVIVQDADLEQEPKDFPGLLQPLLDGRADVVFGSRFSGQYLPRAFLMSAHYLVNRFFTLTCNLLSGYRTRDMWTGYKMYSRRALDAFLPHLRSNGIEFEPEITLLLAKLGFRIMDVPITYRPRWYAEGKKTNWKQALRAYVKMLGFAFRKVSSPRPE